MAADEHRLNPAVARWLRAEVSEGLATEAGPDWDGWLLRRMNRGAILCVGGVFVDRAVVEQRFACVPERCAPGPDRGRWRSCCADAQVTLSSAEQRRLAGRQKRLAAHLCAREEWLEGCARGFWRDAEGSGIARPGGRCAFSKIDRAGRIRCHLRDFARGERLEQSAVQPLSCRLFPLVLVDLGERHTLLTVVSRATHRLVSTWPPARYPCLSDPSLPPLVRSMRADLDWLFGAGFARALTAAGRSD